jgi:hypothetical protein
LRVLGVLLQILGGDVAGLVEESKDDRVRFGGIISDEYPLLAVCVVL